jgi:DNA-binding response OmpR family regulator
MRKPSESNLQVLLVEPDASISEVITSHLSQRGIDAIAVSSPTQALETLQKSAFHFVISELELPEYSGWDLSLNIRDLKMKSLPEILLISDEKFVDIEMAHQSGACHMLGKPLEFELLVDTLKHYSPRPEDQRRFDRVDVDPKFYGPMNGQLKTTQGDTQTFQISNIGRGGLFMELSTKEIKEMLFTKGQIIDFNATLSMVPDFAITGKGIIRWTKEGMYTIGAGVEFLYLEPDTESLIDSYVKLFRVKPFVPGRSS